jgi:2'-5' RNA ligase
VSQTFRLFIAIELPNDVREMLHQTLQTVRKAIPEKAVRWVPPENLHLTLKFLGDVPQKQVADLTNSLRYVVADHAPFHFEIKGVGCFPNLAKPRVIWLGLDDAHDELHALRDAVERIIAPMGFPTERRAFNPHLTIGRVRRDASKSQLTKIGQGIKGLRVGKIAEWPCSGVSLMKSDLQPSGAVYTCLAHEALPTPTTQ